ncbi:Crp/Fnr family transcriptional regulator [Chryseobacterium sp.]|uniref:Crp/Fnr family transcriptional regulator n=1 Tax=Chryseobacterium sp. TaxID=1871047 RepID=UPI00388E2452
MPINKNHLYEIGAVLEKYNAGDYIFRENGTPQFYYQILTGEIKLNNYHSDGKEFIQNILSTDDSIGESLLFTEKAYPMNARALTECSLLKLSKTSFYKLLELQPQLYLMLCKALSERLYKKYILIKSVSCHSASERQNEVMQLMKQEQDNQSPFTFEIPLTRQQLASLTGLCIETTIRTIKKMERQKLLRIENRKIMY